MKKGQVLIIDDEKDLIELIRYNLEKEGFLVKSASDGESGLAIAVRESPDIILIDLMLPGIDGLEVCRSLRSDNRTARIPLIMLTAKSAESDRILGLELGADDYVVQPRGAYGKNQGRAATYFHAADTSRYYPVRQIDHRSGTKRGQLQRTGCATHGNGIPLAAVSCRSSGPRLFSRSAH
jgi:CheY-like chemotaxis protein